jgi:hypothetical protein
MKWFDITNFPKFSKESESYSGTLDEKMRRMGYKTATFKVNGTMKAWGMSEEDYTWFLLRYS